MDILQLNTCYTCQLKSISGQAESIGKNFIFSLSRQGIIIFSSSNVSDDRDVYIYGLDEIIEDDLLKRGRQYGGYTLTVEWEEESYSRTFDAVFCKRMPVFSASELMQTRFFRTLVTDECRPGKPIFLSFFSDEDVTLDTSARIDGVLHFAQRTFQGQFLSCSPETVASSISPQIDASLLSEFVLQVNKPTGPVAHFVCINDEPDISFVFRNKFNAWQAIYLDATISQKIQSKRSIAKAADGSLIQYDQDNKLSLEIKCVPISWSKALAVTELLESHDVRILTDQADPGSMPKVIIEAEDFEMPRDPNNNIAPKFSISMADSEQSIHFGQFPGLFSDQFSLPFD